MGQDLLLKAEGECEEHIAQFARALQGQPHLVVFHQLVARGFDHEHESGCDCDFQGPQSQLIHSTNTVLDIADLDDSEE
eukprot:CAMPEP_0170472802 /NCGR_PEP_ID=MMETSP0123-20130129/14797_1 /TAXON_ID=182087 /ORGANISM="Favella ehrenbergii, Strain Fehren 1" /LENGTH=78 /DNA_ID=CAMNT_0010741365 /DNA_START=896 /DNA_END=1132 /DNA_ORIENTATION=+